MCMALIGKILDVLTADCVSVHSQSTKCTSAEELVDKIKKLRYEKPVDRKELAMKLLKDARKEGTTTIAAYNGVLKV